MKASRSSVPEEDGETGGPIQLFGHLLRAQHSGEGSTLRDPEDSLGHPRRNGRNEIHRIADNREASNSPPM